MIVRHHHYPPCCRAAAPRASSALAHSARPLEPLRCGRQQPAECTFLRTGAQYRYFIGIRRV